MQGITKRRVGVRMALLGIAFLGPACGADGRGPAVQWAEARAKDFGRDAVSLYHRTPADERMTWGGLAACALLGLGVSVGRVARLRKGRIIPRAFAERFHARLVEGKLDRGKALDYCELNPSPAARIVLAAVRRWGRPAADLDRGVSLAKQVEVDRLKRHVATLRRLAALAPLIGLLGTLLAAHRGLLTEGAAWAPAVARSLATLTSGVALSILCLVAYDGLSGRVEALSGALDRIGAEAVDAIAMAPSGAFVADAKGSARTRREAAEPRPIPRQRPAGQARSEIPLESD